MTLIELVFIVDPKAVERARRLEAALRLLEDGRTRREVSGELQRQHRLTQSSAWRLVDMAVDLKGPR